MGEAKITILLKDGNVATKRDFKAVTIPEISSIITNLDMMKQELLEIYKNLVIKK